MSERAESEALRGRIDALIEIVRDSPCPYDGITTGTTVANCQQCGCSHGLMIQPFPTKAEASAIAAAERVAGEDGTEKWKILYEMDRDQRDFERDQSDELRAEWVERALKAERELKELRAVALSPGKEPDLGWLQGENETIRERRPSDDLDDLCAACGEPRREHVTPGGTRYGPTTLCGVFIPREPLSPGKWREIESAPKDGTPVLLWRPYHSVTQAHAYPECWKDFPSTNPKWFWQLNRSTNSDRAHSEVPFEPTHWMPVPSPPIRFIDYQIDK